MKIAMLNITSGGMSGGYRKYLDRVIPRLASHPKVSALLVGMPETIDFSKWEKEFSSVKWLALKPTIWPVREIGSETKKRIKEFAPDVVFIPTARFWRMNGVPTVNMIRNMEPLVFPNEGNPASEVVRNWLRVWETRKAASKADRLIAVSSFVKDFLIKCWGISGNRIGMVYHGIDVPQKESNGVSPPYIPNSWSGRFLFTAGSIRPARGLEDAISALTNLIPNNIVDIAGLVIAGTTDYNMLKYRKGLERKIKENKIINHVCWVGSLNEQEMKWCYQNCSVFIMTSRVESFGMIAGEAMSHGCICVAADNPCMPEVFGDAAIYYSPKNGRVLAGAIQTALSWDSHQRIEASEGARKRAAEFSWDVTVERTVTELEKVL